MDSLYTVGHSTRSLKRFVDLLQAYEVKLLVDVRRYPTSRRCPQFSKLSLEKSLGKAGLEYRHAEVLGGYRKPVADSPNDAWSDKGFQGFVDHLNTVSGQKTIAYLQTLASANRLALMCAEQKPWRCHRQLIADVLVSRGLKVLHILEANQVKAHKLHKTAWQLPTGRLIYPGEKGVQKNLFG